MMTRRWKSNQKPDQEYQAPSLIHFLQASRFSHRIFQIHTAMATLAAKGGGRWPYAPSHCTHLCIDQINSTLIVKALWGGEKGLLLL